MSFGHSYKKVNIAGILAGVKDSSDSILIGIAFFGSLLLVSFLSGGKEKTEGGPSLLFSLALV